MKTYYDSSKPKTEPYKPEKPNHVRMAVKTLFVMLVYHGMSWLVYDLFIGNSVIQMMRDGLVVRTRWTMFIFAMLGLLIISATLAVFYMKNGDRKRAFLAATSVEVRGSAEGAAEGATRYRKLALKESLICTLSTGAMWMIPTAFYAISRATAGIGYGYGEAWGLETFFVSFAGLCEPFQNSWIGLLLGMGILFAFHYFGRLRAHRIWAETRIRK
jgi:hypothetical protein